jgi:transcriptional regulator with XRE-family HTH domain
MKLNIEPLIFNVTLKETMDSMELQGAELAEAAGRTRQNISEIRQGKAFPSVRDFALILMAAEQRVPGFFNEFVKRFVQKLSRLPVDEERGDLNCLIEEMGNDELTQMMYLISGRLMESMKERKGAEKDSKKELVGVG